MVARPERCRVLRCAPAAAHLAVTGQTGAWEQNRFQSVAQWEPHHDTPLQNGASVRRGEVWDSEIIPAQCHQQLDCQGVAIVIEASHSSQVIVLIVPSYLLQQWMSNLTFLLFLNCSILQTLACLWSKTLYIRTLSATYTRAP